MKAQSAEVTAMQYGFMQTIPLPDETYEEVHAQVTAAAGERVPGLYVHFARSTPNGYQLVEVWESKQHYDRFFEQVVNALVFGVIGCGVVPFDQNLMPLGLRQNRQRGNGLIGVGHNRF